MPTLMEAMVTVDPSAGAESHRRLFSHLPMDLRVVTVGQASTLYTGWALYGFHHSTIPPFHNSFEAFLRIFTSSCSQSIFKIILPPARMDLDTSKPSFEIARRP